MKMNSSELPHSDVHIQSLLFLLLIVIRMFLLFLFSLYLPSDLSNISLMSVFLFLDSLSAFSPLSCLSLISQSLLSLSLSLALSLSLSLSLSLQKTYPEGDEQHEDPHGDVCPACTGDKDGVTTLRTHRALYSSPFTLITIKLALHFKTKQNGKTMCVLCTTGTTGRGTSFLGRAHRSVCSATGFWICSEEQESCR